MSVARWEVPRESDHVWLGPVTVTTTADGQPVAGVTVQFALLPAERRPTTSDWASAAPDPEGLSRAGVNVPAVSSSGTFGLWVRVVDGATTYVIEPDNVGWLDRT